MLNNDAYQNIELIMASAQEVWGGDAELGEIKVLDVPVPMFELVMRLYGQFGVKLEYDRSTLSIGVPTEEGYVALSRVAGEHVFRGFDGMKPENLLYNFGVLDRLIQKQRIN